MPALRNAWDSAAAARRSSPGTSWSSISMIVTRVPSSAKIAANSQPIAPPPTIARLAGRWSSSSSWSLVITRWSSTSNTGSMVGREPVAMMTASPVRSRTPPPAAPAAPDSPAWPVTRTVWASTSRPKPATTSTLRALRRCSTPPRCCSTTAALRASSAPKSTRGSPSTTPKPAASRARRSRSVAATRALVGMQPRLRQVPPIARDSTSATRAPSCAARRAATYPAGPPPRTTILLVTSASPYLLFVSVDRA